MKHRLKVYAIATYDQDRGVLFEAHDGHEDHDPFIHVRNMLPPRLSLGDTVLITIEVIEDEGTEDAQASEV